MAERVVRAAGLVVVVVLCCAGTAVAQSAQPCGVHGGALDGTVAKFHQFTSAIFTYGLLSAQTFAVSYAAFRSVLVGFEALPELRAGVVVFVKLISKVIVPLALTLMLIQAVQGLWQNLLAAAASYASSTGVTVPQIGAITPSTVFGEFACLSAGVSASGAFAGITGNFGGFLSSYITSSALTLCGILIAGALLFFLAKAALTVPIGAPLLGGLVGPDGKSVAMSYATHCVTVLIEVATVSLMVGLAEWIAQDASMTNAGAANMQAWEEETGVAVLFTLFSWGLPHVAGRVLGGPAAVTMATTVSMIGRAMNSARSAGQTIAAGVGTGGAGTAAAVGAKAAGAAASAGASAASSAGKKGTEIFGRELP